MPFELQTRAGEPLNQDTVREDVKRLWASGRFGDIRVESANDSVVFHVTEKPRYELRTLILDPPDPSLNLNVQPKTLIDDLWTNRLVADARKKLRIQGFKDASVNAELVPVNKQQADVRLTIDKGQHYRVQSVNLSGDLGAPEKDVRRALNDLKTRRMLPGIPGIWKGWSLVPSLSDEAIQADAARLRSFYNGRGYYDAAIRLDHLDVNGTKAHVDLNIQAGPRHSVREANLFLSEGVKPLRLGADGSLSMKSVCKELFAERRKAERQGVLDFNARMEIRDVPAGEDPAKRHMANVSIFADRGPAYGIGRIEFKGNKSVNDITLRKLLLISEGLPMDQLLLRKSLDRMNRTGLLEPLSENDVVINTPTGTDRADLTIWVKERKSRSWFLSGPIGTTSFGGPVNFSLSSRLPSWGRGILEMSTYAASLRFVAYAEPLSKVFSFLPNRRFMTLVTIHRPLLPGQRFLSGFSVSPQLGWKGMALGYGLSQTQGLFGPLFESDRAFTQELSIRVSHIGANDADPPNESLMYCEVPKTKLDWTRQIGGVAVNALFTLAPL